MTREEIQTIAEIFTSLIIPFVIAKWNTLGWSSGKKQALLLILSLGGGLLSAAIEGKPMLGDITTLAKTTIAIIFGAQATYQVFLKGLGLEKVLDPKEALVSEGTKQVKTAVEKMPIETAKAALDSSDPSTNILVQTSIV